VALRRLTRIHVRSVEQLVDLDDGDDVFNYPWLYAVEVGHWQLTDTQVKQMRDFLDRGGFFMCDDFLIFRTGTQFFIQFTIWIIAIRCLARSICAAAERMSKTALIRTGAASTMIKVAFLLRFATIWTSEMRGSTRTGQSMTRNSPASHSALWRITLRMP
jgi:hypothetical protein